MDIILRYRYRTMMLIALIGFIFTHRHRIMVLIALLCFILAMLLGGGAPEDFILGS